MSSGLSGLANGGRRLEQLLARLRLQVGQIDAAGGRQIGDQPALAAGAGEDAQSRTGRPPVGREQLGGLHQLVESRRRGSRRTA